MAKLKIYKDTITPRNEEFEKLVLKTQEQMKEFVKWEVIKYGDGDMYEDDGYVFHKGTFPVLLCAHMDTVHKQVPSTMVYANGTLSSTQGIGGDDRCGIYMIFKILQKYDCSVVFLEDEEIGCVGARKFANSKICKELKAEGNLKYIIEFDRKGNNHAVTYDCDNKEFDAFITKEFFKKEYGTCSDISYIAPEIGVAAVNLSCGYYKEHHLEEWVNLAEMEAIIDEAMKLLERTKELTEPFKYIRSTYGGYYGYGYRYSGYGDRYYDDDNYYYSRYYGNYGNYYDSLNKNNSNSSNNNSSSNKNWRAKKRYTFRYKKDTSIREVIITAEDKKEAYYNFFKTYQHVRYIDIIDVKESL